MEKIKDSNNKIYCILSRNCMGCLSFLQFINEYKVNYLFDIMFHGEIEFLFSNKMLSKKNVILPVPLCFIIKDSKKHILNIDELIDKIKKIQENSLINDNPKKGIAKQN